MASLIFTDQPCEDFNIAYGSPIVIQYETFNICTVPNSAYDGLLVFILGIVLFGLLAGRALAAMWLFVLGFFICAASFLLGPLSIFSNGIALWLDIVPGDLLVYVFLPGLLLDEALRIQFHFFKRYLVQSLVLAFLVAITSTSLLVVFMLYGLQLESLYGWTVAHAALFGSIIVATDAVSVSAILKSAGAPEHLDFMLRGESLFNDGTSLVLFSIFLTQTTNMYTLNQPFVLDWVQLASITGTLLYVAITGVIIGFAFGMLHSAILQLIKRRPWAPEAELTFTLAMGYLSFYVAQVPYLIGSSGAIAVVVFGLYGAWTERYALSGQLLVSGQFDAFYTAVMFCVNGIIFVYAGMATLAFLLISLPVLTPEDYDLFLFNTAWMAVAIFIVGFAFRFLCTLLLQPLFMFAGKSLDLKGVSFVTAAGLRGALSLMLLRTVILVPWVTAGGAFDQDALLIQAQMVIWGAAFVFFTLVVNAPLLSPLLKLLGLDKVPEGKLRFRKKVHNMCEDAASQSFEDIKAKLALTSGSRIDWGLVRRLQDVNSPIALEELGIDPNVWYRRFGRWFSNIYTCAFCRQQPDDQSILDEPSKGSSPINEDVWAPFLMSGSLLHASFMPTYAGSNVLESVKRKMKAVVTLMKFQKSPQKTPEKDPSTAGEADTILSGIEEGQPAAMESAGSTVESIVAEDIAEMEDEEDARIRLLSGLKNKISESYAAGLISLQGLVIFNEVCDTAIIDANEPLTICQKLLSTVNKSLTVKFADSSISFLHQIDDCMDISCGNSAVYKPFIRMRSDAIFDSTAVVQEYSNALLDCSSASFPKSLLQEVQKEQFQARCYIRDREVEFSGLYYVALTQRAAMSLLSDRAAFVRGLHNSGLIDDAEKEVMGTAVEQRMLELRNNGLQYRAPPPLEMIASLPFLQCIPSEQRNAILDSVKRYNYEAGETVWKPYVPVPDVSPASSLQLRLQSRAARGEIDDSDMLLVYTGVLQAASGSGSHGVVYWGQGGVIGLLSAIHAARPGGDIHGADACRDHPEVVAPKESSKSELEGSQVRAFGLPKSIFVQIRKEAAEGNAVMQLAELSAFRMAAIMEFHSGTSALADLKRQLQDAMRSVQTKPPLFRPPSRTGTSFTAQQSGPSRELLAKPPSMSTSAGMLRSRTFSFSAKPSATVDDFADELKRTVDGQVEEIMRQITRGELKQLEEGEEMEQYEHVVVLGGSVQQSPADEPASFAAPCIAVCRERLLSDIGRQDPEEGEQLKLVAGSNGAVLLVLPPTFL